MSTNTKLPDGVRLVGKRTIKLADIKTNLFVRESLDENWVLQLAEWIGQGVQMDDPIEVTDEGDGVYEMVDGRHRKEAYVFNSILEQEVRILKFDSPEIRLAYAYKRNKGSKPPTDGDTQHTIRQMEKMSVGVKRIAELLGFPAKLVQSYLKEIRSNEKRVSLQRGAELVRNHNRRVVEAAAEVNVTMEELRAHMNGQRKRTTKVGEVKKQVQNLFRGFSTKSGRLLGNLLDQFEIGDMSKKQVDEIFEKVDSLKGRFETKLADLKARFAAKSGDGKESTAGGGEKRKTA